MLRDRACDLPNGPLQNRQAIARCSSPSLVLTVRPQLGEAVAAALPALTAPAATSARMGPRPALGYEVDHRQLPRWRGRPQGAQQAAGEPRRVQDVIEGYAADWSVGQLCEPAQRISDRTDELMKAT